MNRKITTTAVLTAIILFFTALSLRAQNATVGAWYQFENNAADSSGGAYDAVNNNVTYSADIAGVGSSAGHFSGLNSYFSLPNGWIGSSNFVGFSLWFKTQGNVKPSGLAYAGLESIGNTPYNWTPLMWIDSTGHLAGMYYDGSMIVCTSADTVNDDQWHHAVFFMYYNGSTIGQELWLDGKSEHHHTNLGGGGGSFANIYIGACNARGCANMPDAWMYFKGEIDEAIGFTANDELQRHKIMHNYDLAITEHPQDVNAVLNGPATMHISRTNFEPDSAYTYQWVRNGMSVLIGQTDSTLDIPNVQWSDTGYYQCFVKNSNNFEVASYEGHLTAVPASVKNTASESIVKTYPNPANNVVFVDLEGTGTYEVSVLNLTGQTLISRKGVTRNARLDVGSLTPGIYTISVKDANRTRYQKFIKDSN